MFLNENILFYYYRFFFHWQYFIFFNILLIKTFSFFKNSFSFIIISSLFSSLFSFLFSISFSSLFSFSSPSNLTPFKTYSSDELLFLLYFFGIQSKEIKILAINSLSCSSFNFSYWFSKTITSNLFTKAGDISFI